MQDQGHCNEKNEEPKNQIPGIYGDSEDLSWSRKCNYTGVPHTPSFQVDKTFVSEAWVFCWDKGVLTFVWGHTAWFKKASGHP